MICTKNATVKALQSHLVGMKKVDERAAREWAMTFNTKGPTMEEPCRPKVYGQTEAKRDFNRYGQHCGASKAVHTIDCNGEAFKYICIKRIKRGAWLPDEGSGNQLHDEVEAWERFANTAEADYLCPCLKSFETKSDHNNPRTLKALDNIVVIAQKAEDVCVLSEACRKAEAMNKRDGYNFVSARVREAEMVDFAAKMGWWDVRNNGGNSGIIFDFAKNQWKAVFIDYAL